MIMNRLAASILGLAAVPAFAGGLTPEVLASLARLSDPQVSPDGTAAVFVLTETNLETNRRRSDIWRLELDDRDAEPRRLTENDVNDSAPQWSADGEFIYYLSEQSGSSQVWRMPAEGGRALQVTDFPVDVANLLVSPSGRRIAFTAEVFPDCETFDCTAQRLDEAEHDNRSGRLYERLFVRHWSTWEDGRRSSLFTAALGDDGKASGDPVEVSGDLDGDVPSVPFGGREEIAFAPDGEALFFTLREAGQTEPWSMNFDIFRAPADGSAPPANLTPENDAVDKNPVVSPDGQRLVWGAMRRPGYESDQVDIMIRDLASGETRNLTEGWDRSAGDIVFGPDGESLYVTAGDIGTSRIFRVALADGAVEPVTDGPTAAELEVAGDRLVFVRDSFAAPADLYALPLDGEGEATRLTAVNADALADVEIADYEQFHFEGAEGDTVYGYVFRPVGFEEGETYPIAFLIHGGPQGSFGEGWSYRWNPQTYAAQGYGVVTVDFHGSRSYGQDFVDSINGDWGGKPLEDLQKGLAAAIEQNPWLEADNACALGASYGGYMINWIAGQWPDRFKCLVNHDGLFDLRSFYYATEELWFPEWDFGAPYYEAPEAYERWNPVNYVSEWQTPMLVIHGLEDYRVPAAQGLGAFTALQRQGIPSKLLIFPDENHWVLSPGNSIQWHETVAGWLQTYLSEE
ncbi:MAG TPA: S9 family peptidase [Woeseiaceae bacterium]|nr:S9 family peptidase [Woeseiaceae bacterium]